MTKGFLSELIARFGSQTPEFFKKFASRWWASLILGALGIAFLIYNKTAAFIEIDPELYEVMMAASTGAFFAGLGGIVTAKSATTLPQLQDEATKTGVLKVSAAADLVEAKNQPSSN